MSFENAWWIPRLSTTTAVTSVEFQDCDLEQVCVAGTFYLGWVFTCLSGRPRSAMYCSFPFISQLIHQMVQNSHDEQPWTGLSGLTGFPGFPSADFHGPGHLQQQQGDSTSNSPWQGGGKWSEEKRLGKEWSNGYKRITYIGKEMIKLYQIDING